MLDNQLELYIKNNETNMNSIVECLEKNHWIDRDEVNIVEKSIHFISGEYEEDYRITLQGDTILVEGNNSYEVVQIWEHLKAVAL